MTVAKSPFHLSSPGRRTWAQRLFSVLGIGVAFVKQRICRHCALGMTTRRIIQRFGATECRPLERGTRKCPLPRTGRLGAWERSTPPATLEIRSAWTAGGGCHYMDRGDTEEDASHKKYQGQLLVSSFRLNLAPLANKGGNRLAH